MEDIIYNYANLKIPISKESISYVKDFKNYKEVQAKYKDKIAKKSWKEALELLFGTRLLSLRSKQAIRKIIIDEDNDIISLQMDFTDEAFKKREELFEKTGWYFFVTGVPPEVSLISKIVDEIKKDYDKTFIEKNWKFDESGTLKLRSLISKNVGNSFLLTIGNKKVVLDAGFTLGDEYHPKDISSIITTEPLAVFLSHAHADHYQGLIDLFKQYNNTALLCSKTTLDYFVFLRKKRDYYREGKNFKIKETDVIYKIIRKSVTVRARDTLNFNNCTIKFHFSGHMPGALMLSLHYKGKKMLYTGDFHYFDMYPVTGVERAISEFPHNIDLAVIEGAIARKDNVPLNKVVEKLLTYLKKNIRKHKKVLIITDPASLGIILFLRVDGYFRELQKREGFNLRPKIVLDRDCMEFVRILQHRKEDLHPELLEFLNKKMNPFMSGLVKYVKNIDELNERWNSDENQIYILGSSKLDCYELSFKAFELAKDTKDNLIFITGTVRKALPLEIISGNEEIEHKRRKIKIKAEIYNVVEPESELHLHADKGQILRFIEKIRPKRVILFHSSRRDLVGIRQEIKRRYNIQTLVLDEDLEYIVS